jgi:hypothetical protein
MTTRVAALFVLAATLICLSDALTVPPYASRVYPQKQTVYGTSYPPGNPAIQIILTDKGVWITGRNFSTHRLENYFFHHFFRWILVSHG